jgi:hypothetical protein
MTNTYVVEYQLTIEGSIEVEAESADEARDLVENGNVSVIDNNHDSEDVETQDTYRADGTLPCGTCDYDEDTCTCELCDECDMLVEDCECEEEEDDEDEDDE